MNDIAILDSAINYLKELNKNTTKGSWHHEGLGGSWAITNEHGDIVTEDVIHGADADLIVTARNTLNAQLVLLTVALEETYTSDEARASLTFVAAVALAKSILAANTH
jgi:hypothetical protein